LLPAPIHEHYHILLCPPQPQRFYQPRKFLLKNYRALALYLTAHQFFIAPWVTRSGYTWTFAVQGIITFFISVPVIATVHFFGARLRAWSGQPPWVNPEYDSK
jgi:hypothetical protein